MTYIFKEKLRNWLTVSQIINENTEAIKRFHLSFIQKCYVNLNTQLDYVDLNRTEGLTNQFIVIFLIIIRTR